MNINNLYNIIYHIKVENEQEKSSNLDDDGIVVIDDDLKIDTEKELEERRAFLEEARSQDASD